jgi:cytochrome P450
VDLWSDEAILDAYRLYGELRDTAGAVWQSKYDLFVLTRYTDVRQALQNWRVFSSAQGVMMNDPMNEAMRGILLCTDPPEHEVLRGVASADGASRAQGARAAHRAGAQKLVVHLVAQRTFDGAIELAQHSPVTIVSNLVGFPRKGRAHAGLGAGEPQLFRADERPRRGVAAGPPGCHGVLDRPDAAGAAEAGRLASAAV